MKYSIGTRLEPVIRKGRRCSGNAIIAAKHDDDHWTIFTDFGNIVTLSEKEIDHHYQPLNGEDVPVGENDLSLWMRDRYSLIAEQKRFYDRVNKLSIRDVSGI